MTYRMVVLDVDGTLLHPRGQVRPAVKTAVREVIDRGVLVTLATGRRFDSARNIAAELGVDLPLILHGGTVIQDSLTGQVIYEDAMPVGLVGDVIEEILRSREQPVLYRSPAVGDELLTGPPQRDGSATADYLARQPNVRRSEHQELRRVERVISVRVFQHEDRLRPLYDRLRKWPGCKVLLWEPDPMYPDPMHILDVLNAGCSKAKALSHLAASHGIRMAEVMAIGDQINDLEMLDAVGLGVAMGNAPSSVRERVKVVVGTNEEDGVAEALRRFVLGGAADADLDYAGSGDQAGGRLQE